MVFDPRVGLALLVFANLAAFSEQPFWMEMIWIGFLLFLMLLHRCFAMAGKSLLIFGGILCLQYWILPAAPGWAATSFSISKCCSDATIRSNFGLVFGCFGVKMVQQSS